MMMNNDKWFEDVLDDEAEQVRTYQPEFNGKGAKIPMPTLNWIDKQRQEGKQDTINWLSKCLAKLEAGERTDGFSEEMAQESMIELKKRITELKKEIK